jgi:hypothetical protein
MPDSSSATKRGPKSKTDQSSYQPRYSKSGTLLGCPSTGNDTPFIDGKTTWSGRTRVPSATRGTRLGGGSVPRTTQSSRARKSARKLSSC